MYQDSMMLKGLDNEELFEWKLIVKHNLDRRIT